MSSVEDADAALARALQEEEFIHAKFREREQLFEQLTSSLDKVLKPMQRCPSMRALERHSPLPLRT
jgi:hypothetical protein